MLTLLRSMISQLTPGKRSLVWTRLVIILVELQLMEWFMYSVAETLVPIRRSYCLYFSDNNEPTLSSLEIYDPDKKTWTSGAAVWYPEQHHSLSDADRKKIHGVLGRREQDCSHWRGEVQLFLWYVRSGWRIWPRIKPVEEVTRYAWRQTWNR